MLNIGSMVKSGTYSQDEMVNRVNVMQTGDYYGEY